MTEDLRLEPTRRLLRPAEVRLLENRLRAVTRNTSRRHPFLTLSILLVFVCLWGLTILASEASWTVVTIFWILTGGAITLWVRSDFLQSSRDEAVWAGRLESALERNAADVYDIRARAFVEFEEFEDEGACYAFELDRDRLLFISGQEFYPGNRFPSLDFGLVHILDEDDQSVDVLIEKRGPRVAPARMIPASSKWSLGIPEHMEIRSGTLDRLELILGRDAAGP